MFVVVVFGVVGGVVVCVDVDRVGVVIGVVVAAAVNVLVVVCCFCFFGRSGWCCG